MFDILSKLIRDQRIFLFCWCTSCHPSFCNLLSTDGVRTGKVMCNRVKEMANFLHARSYSFTTRTWESLRMWLSWVFDMECGGP